MNEEKLIFLLSLPRSGSTLLQSMLSKISSVQTSSESWFLLTQLILRRSDLVKASYDWDATSMAVNEFIDNEIKRERYTEEQKDFILKIYSKLQKTDLDYVLDKTPRYFEIADEILDFFPKSKYVYLKRNPLSVLNSILGYSNITSYTQLLWWGRDLLIAPKKLKEVEDRSKICYYEDLVENPEKVMNAITNEFDIANNENLDFNVIETSKIKGSFGDSNIYAKNEIDSTSTFKWESLFEGKWKGFASGYVDFLLSRNLIDSKYNSIKKFANKDKDFDLFQKIIENKLNENYFSKITLQNQLAFLIKSRLFKW